MLVLLPFHLIYQYPSLPQPVKFLGSKVQPYTLPNSISGVPITTLLSILCLFIEICTHAHAKGLKKSFNDFKFDILLVVFRVMAWKVWQ